MHLLIVAEHFWPENFRINDLALALQQRGVRVTVLAAEPNYPDGVIFPEYAANKEAFANYEGIEVLRVPTIPRGRRRIQLAANALGFIVFGSLVGAWKVRNLDFDAMFVYEPSPVTVGIPAIVFRAFRRVPIVFWVLDLWPETLRAVGMVNSPFVLSAVGQVVRFIYSNCSLVLGQSRSFESDIRKYAPPSVGVRYFPNWAESIFEFDPATTERAPEIKKSPGVFDILFAGNIGEAQDFFSILEAVELLRSNPNVRWWIVGDGRAQAAALEQVKQRGLAEHIRFLGRFALERMPSFYVAADALLVTLKTNPIFAMTIPGKLQTYMIAGKPILAMLDGEGAAIIEQSQCGLVAPTSNPQALARNVEAMLALSDSEREAMGARGRVFAQKEFNKDRLVEQLCSWLEELSTEARTSPA